jgi:hypothetical protein
MVIFLTFVCKVFFLNYHNVTHWTNVHACDSLLNCTVPKNLRHHHNIHAISINIVPFHLDTYYVLYCVK